MKCYRVVGNRSLQVVNSLETWSSCVLDVVRAIQRPGALIQSICWEYVEGTSKNPSSKQGGPYWKLSVLVLVQIVHSP